MQLAGYALANIAGLTLVLCALCFYADVAPAMDGDDALSQDYIVVSRSVSMLSTLGIGNGASGITVHDIEQLRSQPWVEDVGEFTSADFGVTASVNFGGRDMWTYLFLESVPDRFFDVKPEGWSFDPTSAHAYVPIIISRDYLALYNFGFASSRGLPQLSEDLITQIPLDLYVNGHGKSANFKARIVGFSNRLNTIAVPQEFMQWANSEFGTSAALPSRLVVKVGDPGNPHIKEYLDANGYEVAGEGLRDGKVHFMLAMLAGVVGVVGIVICLLSVFIIMLNITLLMQKNKEKNRELLLLGYSPANVEWCYCRLVLAINAFVLIASITLMLIFSHLWQSKLAQAGIPPGSCVPAISIGAAIMCAITVFNWLSIRRAVRKCI